jgi:phospholipase C
MRVRVGLGLAVVATVLATLPATLASGTAAAGGSRPAHQIKHIVVLMQENRSADTYFGQLSIEGQPAYEPEPTTGNPDPLHPGHTIVPFHKTTLCETSDLNHSWNGTHQEWDNGAMDGFTAANDINSDNSDAADPSGTRTMGFYDRNDLPFYYALYKKFATGDRYFASVLSQTFPNRFYLLAGTSFGHIRNDFPPPNGFTQPTIFNLLDAAHISWKIYFSQIPFAFEFAYVRNHVPGNVVPIKQYYDDAKAGALPQVSFVDPIFAGPPNVENDEHPPSNVQVGQQFARKIVNRLEKSPNWSTSALFFTYDEHGGFYDHVPPPAAVKPDNIAPMLQAGDTPGAFDRYGIRVPVVVVSPFARHHFVSHVVHDHTSILRFIEVRFGLPALTARDAAADPMLEFFDFAHPPFSTPPPFTKPAVTPCP